MKILHALLVNMIICPPSFAGEIPASFTHNSQSIMAGSESVFKRDRTAGYSSCKLLPATSVLPLKDRKKGFDPLSWDGRVRFRLGKNISLALTYN
jgi:hypothetical protein